MAMPETTDEISGVVIQPLNIYFCAFLFAGLTFANYQYVFYEMSSTKW